MAVKYSYDEANAVHRVRSDQFGESTDFGHYMDDVIGPGFVSTAHWIDRAPSARVSVNEVVSGGETPNLAIGLGAHHTVFVNRDQAVQLVNQLQMVLGETWSDPHETQTYVCERS